MPIFFAGKSISIVLSSIARRMVLMPWKTNHFCQLSEKKFIKPANRFNLNRNFFLKKGIKSMLAADNANTNPKVNTENGNGLYEYIGL